MQEDQPQQQKEGLKNHTIVFMIVVALFFDVLQWALAFVFMDWLAGFFAFLTFFVWFKLHGISFMRPKRALTMGGAAIIEIVPLLSALPAWTLAVVILALDTKIKKVLPKAAQDAISSTPSGKKQ